MASSLAPFCMTINIMVVYDMTLTLSSLAPHRTSWLLPLRLQKDRHCGSLDEKFCEIWSSKGLLRCGFTHIPYIPISAAVSKTRPWRKRRGNPNITSFFNFSWCKQFGIKDMKTFQPLKHFPKTPTNSCSSNFHMSIVHLVAVASLLDGTIVLKRPAARDPKPDFWSEPEPVASAAWNSGIYQQTKSLTLAPTNQTILPNGSVSNRNTCDHVFEARPVVGAALWYWPTNQVTDDWHPANLTPWRTTFTRP